MTKYRAPRKPVPLAPNYHGERVRSTYRVPPFLADEVLTVVLVENVGTRRKPFWRALCLSDRRAAPGRAAGTSILLYR